MTVILLLERANITTPYIHTYIDTYILGPVRVQMQHDWLTYMYNIAAKNPKLPIGKMLVKAAAQ